MTDNHKSLISPELIPMMNTKDNCDNQKETNAERQLNKNRYYSDDIEISSDSSDVEIISDDYFQEIKDVKVEVKANDFESKAKRSSLLSKNTKISDKFRGNYHKRSKRIKTGSDQEKSNPPSERMSLYSRDSRFGIKQLRPKSILKKPMKNLQFPEIERTKRKYNK